MLLVYTYSGTQYSIHVNFESSNLLFLHFEIDIEQRKLAIKRKNGFL